MGRLGFRILATSDRGRSGDGHVAESFRERSSLDDMFMREDMDAVSKERSRTAISLRARREEATTEGGLMSREQAEKAGVRRRRRSFILDMS